MRLIAQIITLVFLGWWPFASMMSIMLYDAPKSTNNSSVLMAHALVLFYPIAFAFLFYILNWTFLTIQPKYFLLATIIVCCAGAFVFGYPRLVFNAIRGISSEGYYIGKESVYYYGSKIPDSDAKTFETLDKLGRYARDNNHVFFSGKPIISADPKTFSLITNTKTGGSSSYSKDTHNVFYTNKIIKGADPSSFVIDDINIVHDKNHLYFFDLPTLPSADPASFELVPDTDYYGKDKKHIFVLPDATNKEGQIIAEADVSTFIPLDDGYSKDKTHIFHRDTQSGVVSMIPNADVATFKTEYDPSAVSDAKDKNMIYLGGKPISKWKVPQN